MESKTEPNVSKAQNYIGGGTPHRKCVYWEGGHRTYFLNRGPIGGDTAHQNRLPVVIGSVRKRWAAGGGWVGWWFHENNARLWLHLAS